MSGAAMLLSQDFALLDAFTGVAPQLVVPKTLPSIVEFAEHHEFCGKKLYPRQRTLLKVIFMQDELFTAYDYHVIDEWLESSQRYEEGRDWSVRVPLDLYERIKANKAKGLKHFNEFIDVGGRRGSKGYIGGLSGGYLIWQMLRLDDPQAYYGLDPGKALYIQIVATSAAQARKHLYSDVASVIMSCQAMRPFILKVQETETRLQTMANIRELASLKGKGVNVAKDIAGIRVIAEAASGSSGRGGASFAQMFDEFAHLQESNSTRSASEVYEAFRPSTAQIDEDAFIYIPSSPYTKTGKFYELYQQAFERDEEGNYINSNMLVFQHPSWELYRDWEYDPQLKRPVIAYNEQMEQLKRRNPSKFRVEYEARFAETIDAYLDPKMVDRMFEPWHGVVLTNREVGQHNRHYRFHADPSKSQANMPIVGGHVEYDEETGFYHAIIDHIKVFQPSDFPPDPETGVPWVDYMEVAAYIVNLAQKFPISEFSFDQWNSVMPIQHIRQAISKGIVANPQMRMREIPFSWKQNWERCEQFKTALYMGWVHAPVVLVDYPGLGEINLASEELKFLQEKNGRVDKQTEGPIQTKDVADCIMQVVVDLLKEQLSNIAVEELVAHGVKGAALGSYMTDEPQRTQRKQQPLRQQSALTIDTKGGRLEGVTDPGVLHRAPRRPLG